jgi:hypothetical protein
MKGNSFLFKAKIWLYEGAAAWHFVTLPSPLAKTIQEFFATYKKGWGSIPVQVTVSQANWKTSIFPDKKSQSYLLPLKSDVRKKLKVGVGDEIKVVIEILV